MTRQATRDTEPELRVRRELHRRGLRYFVDRAPVATARRRRADVVFPSEKVAVFVDGCFWHGCPTHHVGPKSNTAWWAEKISKNRSRDAETTEIFRQAGWEVVRAWEHEDPIAVADRVEEAVLARRGARPGSAPGWSKRTATDPKHKPQVPYRPATTVRREWARYPQEAHLVDPDYGRIRRLRWQEIARIQGFEPGWFEMAGVGPLEAIRAIGDAVPPPLGRAIGEALLEVAQPQSRSVVEICAGAGGLALGLHQAGWEHGLLVDNSVVACRLLADPGRSWSTDIVHEADVRHFDFRAGPAVPGLLAGGPPCQPFSNAGRGQGSRDPRDLLGTMDELVHEVRPEAFLFENVPGLLGPRHRVYLESLLERLSAIGSSGYGVAAGVLDAADFGVPQHRRRLFIVGLSGRTARDSEQVFDKVAGAATTPGELAISLEHVLDPVPDSEWGPWVYGDPYHRNEERSSAE